MTVSLTKPAAIREGVRVRVTDRNVPHLANSVFMGAEGVVEQETSRGDFRVTFDSPDLQAMNTGTWTDQALQALRPVDPETGRPTIDFSDADRDRSKARMAARAAQSRVLDAEHNAVLQQVIDGERVDAYALNAALTQAMSAAATRHGQSMGRRDLTRQIRHLAYIVQAVLENHADGLPAMESGARSPRIKALEIEIEHAGVVNQSLTADLTKLRQERSDLTQAASDERRRLCGQIDSLVDVANKRDALLAETVADRDLLAEVVAYAFEGMTACQQQRVLGFMDARLS